MAVEHQGRAARNGHLRAAGDAAHHVVHGEREARRERDRGAELERQLKEGQRLRLLDLGAGEAKQRLMRLVDGG